MSKKTELEYLLSLPKSEVEHRAVAASERMETRINRAVAEGRDMSAREADLSKQDRDELAALQAAMTCHDEVEARNAELRAEMTAGLDVAMRQRPRPETRAAMSEFVEAVAAGRPVRVQVETRSITSANAGARGAVAVEALGRPQWLWQAAGIPFTPADSLTVQGPLYDALVAQASTNEGADKPTMGDPALASATLKAFAVVQTVSDQVIRFGVGAQAILDRLAAESVFSVNAAFADALETAAGTPIVYATSASFTVDKGIAKVWAQTGSKPTAVLVNSADYPLLSDKAAVGPGDGIGTEVVMFNGTPLLVNDSVTAGVGVVFNGRGFSAHGTAVLLDSMPNLGDNTVTVRAETYAALLQHDAGAIVAVDLAA